MIKYSFPIKGLSERLTAYFTCLIGLLIVISFGCSAPRTACAETLTFNRQAANKNLISENEHQGLKKHILVITSQPYVTDWFTNLNNSFRKQLFSFLSPESKLSYEYIGSESLTDPEYSRKLVDLLKKKYSRITLDMVIAVMPTSSQFLLDHSGELFPEIPVIYVLPSKEQIPIISDRPQSGLVKSASNAIPETIERIRTLLPETEHLLVISGSGADDLNYQKTAEEVLKSKGWPKTVEYLKGVPVAELAVKLERMPTRSAVLVLTYLHDQKGKPLTTIQVMNALSARTAAPMFGFYDTILGQGIVGGRLTSAEAYGDAIAETAQKMFKEGRTSPLVVTIAEARDIYDWRQIEKWHIPKDRLPAESEIRYQEITFWEKHRTKIILVGAVTLLQTFLILALLFNLFRRRRAEALLRSSEKKYHDIFDNAVMGIFQSTPKGTLLSVNPALAQMCGYKTPEEMITDVRNIGQETYVNPEERTRLMNLFAEEGTVKGFQIEHKRKDGSRFWISLSGKTVRDEAGNILYYEGTIEDITQQKSAEEKLIKYGEHLEELVKERTEKLEQANKNLLLEIEEHGKTEKALMKSETMYRDLVEGANSVILRLTSKGTITFSNTFALQFFGFNREELIGQNIIGTIVPEVESSGRNLSLLSIDILKNPAAYERNVNENIKKNGERVWVAWTNKPLMDERGQLTEILSIGTDITKLIETEKELREALTKLDQAKERAEAADRLKSAFLATMSHELRTPLNSIIGFTGILIQRLVGPLNEEQDKQLHMVYNSAKHLLDLINDVLDISKIEAGQLSVAHETFDLRSSIEKVIQSSRPLADKKGLNLSATIAPEISLLTSDRRRIEQILLNLMSNAIKFTEHGFVHVECKVTENEVIIDVKDSGIGIKQEDMGILFNAFQQIESGITRRYEGTGLGLSICKKLAHLLGGEIFVVSEWGTGSTFGLVLPKEGKGA
ncbi:MAG: PAS domain S-box protein [Syntrophaceae bacterium]